MSNRITIDGKEFAIVPVALTEEMYQAAMQATLDDAHQGRQSTFASIYQAMTNASQDVFIGVTKNG